jgi:hypothetical protein
MWCKNKISPGFCVLSSEIFNAKRQRFWAKSDLRIIYVDEAVFLQDIDHSPGSIQREVPHVIRTVHRAEMCAMLHMLGHSIDFDVSLRRDLGK